MTYYEFGKRVESSWDMKTPRITRAECAAHWTFNIL